MSDDRADRLSERRNRSRSQAQGDSESGQDNTQTDEESETTVKEALQGVYLYLEPQQKKRLDRAYNRLKADYEFEYDEPLEKNRHFYRVFAEVGLEQLESMDASDLHEYLERLDSLAQLEP